ncbi:hypothetical protein LCGC14_2443390 [marine sediment metagenome]|uniref:Uncharacterized protein n=1 Tax=marine sediment metagenome TaxID=412755 RepID=A0A0F9BIE6_9ZZZZ
MKKCIVIIAALFLVSGCSFVSNALKSESDTIITESKDGKVVSSVKVTAKAGALVEIEKHDNGEVKSVSVDDRGKPSAISEAIAAIIVIGADRDRNDGD